MSEAALAAWLGRLEALDPRHIRLDLERVGTVAQRLMLEPPAGAVFTIAGTNGKGSTALFLEQLLLASGRRPGTYTSPHLLRYTERVRIAGREAGPPDLVRGFSAVEEARGDIPLTYFEFGTLAALLCFVQADCDAWVLEVGLGGRLDAVNVVDADYALITTIALDHMDWLGGTLEQIAAEKAGIMRHGRPALLGDRDMPAAIRAAADALGAPVAQLGQAFDYEAGMESWSWSAGRRRMAGLVRPPHWADAQFRNASLALAAVHAYEPRLVTPARVNAALANANLPGRFQVVRRQHEWILDVAHNPQAAAVLRARLHDSSPAAATTVVVGMLSDKDIEGFVRELLPVADRWITCALPDSRAADEAGLVEALTEQRAAGLNRGGPPAQALSLAAQVSPPGSRIVVCGSFRMVGPALEWLGLY